MKQLVATQSIRSFTLFAALLTATAVNAAPPIPKLEGRVNDYAHVLSADQQARLRDFLLGQEQRTGNQIVVLTINSLDGDSIEDFSINVARKWNLGQKNNENGVLLVAAINDHKLRIEVNRGLEGVLTDALSSQIIRNEIAPSFRAGDYFDGLWAGVTAIDKVIHGEYKATNPPQSPLGVHVDVGFLLFWMIFFIVILVSHVRFHRYRNHWIGPYWISGSSGGFSGGGFSSGGFSGGGGYSGGGGGGGFGGGGASGSW